MKGDEVAAAEVSALMGRYAQGEDAVFEELYRQLSPRLYRFCMRLAARDHEADDFFQETFLRIHRARTTYLLGANVFHWAFAIARSAYRDRLRYRRRRPEVLGTASDAAEPDRLRTDGGASPEAEARALDLYQRMNAELARMSERNRVAYILLKEEGLSVEEAAAVLGTSKDAVKQRAHRAYEQLRAALGEAGWKEEVGEHGFQAVAAQSS